MLCPPWSEALGTSGNGRQSTLPLTARLSMSKASESELLVEPPRSFGLTLNGGDMGKRQSNQVLVETKVQPLWSRGTDCQVGRAIRDCRAFKEKAQANRECLTSCDDDSNINTGRPVGCPQGIGWHEA
jgi:hypothetical protein